MVPFIVLLAVFSSAFQVLAQPSISNELPQVSHTNDFYVSFDFEDVAPTCCPGPLPTCGDGKCNRTENCQTCPQDCTCIDCGDGICLGSEGETCTTCPQDCGKCQKPPVCGDMICSHNFETCVNCPTDCGTCVVCGDGVCEFTENCATCPIDCGGECSSGILVGRVVDVTTNLPVSNALVVTLQADPADQFHQFSNADGNFFFPELPVASIQLEVTSSLYATTIVTVDITAVETGNVTVFVAPLLPDGQWKVRADWGLRPTDLDIFLFGDWGKSYRSGVVGWETPNKTADVPYAYYSGDRTTGFGPEYVGITQWNRPSQNVEVWVNNYSARRNPASTFSGSGARVIAWTGPRGIVIEATVPASITGNQTWWHVFDITPTQAVIPVNQFYFGAAAPCGWAAYCPYQPLDIFNKRRRK